LIISEIRNFLKKQSHNYRVLLVRASGANFMMNLTNSYTSIYTTALGADPVILGSLSSVSSAINTLISMPSGWISDRYDLKKVMGVGMVIQILMIVMYAFARDWIWILGAMILNPFTMALMYRPQTVMMSKALRDRDRAQGFSLRQVISSSVGIIAPIPAAFIVNYFGGLTVEGIRPLFYLRLAGTMIVYGYVFMKLQKVPPTEKRKKEVSFIKDIKDVFVDGEGLRAWIVISSTGSITMGLIQSFTFLYAAEVKGANAITLGLLSTTATLTSILFSLPISRMADSRGRKFAFLITRPARILWMILLIFAPSPLWLILAWAFRGLSMSGNAYQTWMLELVPSEKRGRWLGVTNTFNSICRIPAPIIGGIIYRDLNPTLLFVIPLILEIFIRIPICYFKVPETLKKSSRTFQTVARIDSSNSSPNGL
jgi:MFS family permease